MEAYTLPTMCETDNQWEVAVRLRECKPGLCNNPEEWEGEVQAPSEAGRLQQVLTTPKKRAFLEAQMGKNLPAMQETRVRSLGQENPLEKKMATHSVLLPGKFHGQRSLVGYSPWGHK